MSDGSLKASAHSCAPTRLSSIPNDMWKLVRECLKTADVAALASVNRQLNRLVMGATGFWQGFQQPEFDLSQRHHRQLLVLYRGKAKVSGLHRVSVNNSTAQELLQGLCIDELSVRGRGLVGLLRAPVSVRSLRLLDHKEKYVLPAALAALRAPHALLQLETSFFLNEAKTRAVLASCQSLQSFSVLSNQSHFGPDEDQAEKVPTSEEEFNTWHKLNGRPFRALEGLADLRRLEVRYRFMGNFDWLSQLETLPLVEELKPDPVRIWHLQQLARLTNVATKLKKLELGSRSDITQTSLNCMAEFRSLCHLDLCGDILEMDERIDFRVLSTLPLRYLGISFRGEENTKCLRDLLSCASLSQVLRRLSIDDCKLTDHNLAGLRAGLHSLALSDCAISNRALAALPRGLKELSLGRQTTDDLRTLDCTVEILHIRNWDFREATRRSWLHLGSLVELRFFACLGMEHTFPALPVNLQRLVFDRCTKLDNACLVSIANGLRTVSLRELEFTDSSIREIPLEFVAAVRSLHTLTIRGCTDFDGATMQDLFQEIPNLYIY